MVDEVTLIETIDKLLVTDIQADATLDIIKSKQAEIINKGRELTKKIIIRKAKLLDLTIKRDLAIRHHSMIVSDSNRNKLKQDKLTEKEMIRKIEYLVNIDEQRETTGIFESILDLENKIESLMLIWKRNDDIADRVENMLNAEINLNRRKEKETINAR